jgi:hypothetical protein
MTVLFLLLRMELAPHQYLPELEEASSRLVLSLTCLSTWVPSVGSTGPRLVLMAALDTILVD